MTAWVPKSTSGSQWEHVCIACALLTTGIRIYWNNKHVIITQFPNAQPYWWPKVLVQRSFVHISWAIKWSKSLAPSQRSSRSLAGERGLLPPLRTLPRWSRGFWAKTIPIAFLTNQMPIVGCNWWISMAAKMSIMSPGYQFNIRSKVNVTGSQSAKTYFRRSSGRRELHSIEWPASSWKSTNSSSSWVVKAMDSHPGDPNLISTETYMGQCRHWVGHCHYFYHASVCSLVLVFTCVHMRSHGHFYSS